MIRALGGGDFRPVTSATPYTALALSSKPIPPPFSGQRRVVDILETSDILWALGCIPAAVRLGGTAAVGPLGERFTRWRVPLRKEKAMLRIFLRLVAVAVILAVGIFAGLASTPQQTVLAGGCTPDDSPGTIGSGPTYYYCPPQSACTYYNLHRILYSDAQNEAECTPQDAYGAYYVQVKIEMCDAPGTDGYLKAYSSLGGALVGSWQIQYNSGDGFYYATSDCFTSSCWPNYWAVDWGSDDSCMYSLEWQVGCCSCSSNPCSS